MPRRVRRTPPPYEEHAPRSSTRVASANASDKSEGFLSSFARKVGIGDATADASKPSASPSPPAAAAPAKPKIAEAKPQSVVRVAPKAEAKQAAKPAAKPQVTNAAAAPATTSSTQLAGSAPVVQTNSFDTRFSAVK